MKKLTSLISNTFPISFFSLSLLLFISATLNAQTPCHQPDDFTYIGSLNGNEYFVSDYTIAAANIFDDAIANGGQAATISSSAENELIRQGLPWFSFIGLADIGDEGNFTWGTGEPLDFTNWGPSEPNGGLNENSVEMNPYNGVWNDIPSSFVRNYVLEIPFVDEDCDGVNDPCDELLGADDSVDNNNDGLPDALYPPATQAEVADAWKCGNKNKKVLVTVNPNNPHTICVSFNSVDAHIANGGWLGPISSCEENEGMVIPESLILESQQSLIKDLDVFPNPVFNGQFTLSIDQNTEPRSVLLRIFDTNGRLVKSENPGNGLSWDIQCSGLPKGLLFLELQVDEKRFYQKIMIQ